MKSNRELYDAIDAVNFSSLKHILVSPLHYQDYLKQQLEEKDEKEQDEELVRYATGTLTHGKVLEGKDLITEFAIKPKKDSSGRAMSFATTEGKIWKAQQTKPILTQAQADQVRFMSDAIVKDKQVAAILRHCKEREVITQAKIAGVDCKALLDCWGHDSTGAVVIPDLKTTKDASPEGFGKAVANFDYDMQCHFYRTLKCHEMNSDVLPTWLWIAVENKRPWAVQCYAPDADALNSGKRKVERAIEVLKKCRETNEWPAYGGGIQLLSMPKWATREN